ncbi:MAG TPA: glutamate 5-kinase [Solirubrobacteraceae bacterium]|jgi:glutamate 5-kinase|nr:glutamate 5-kinase [Solirubrobacteraceae bacterium]
MARSVIKLGSAIVADDDGTLRNDVLTQVCSAVAERHDAGDELVIVTSGAIAAGVRALGLAGRPSSVDELQAASAVGQGRLYPVYDELLRARGVQTAQVLLTFFDLSARANYLNARQTLGKLLEWKVVPVINENDTTATDEISFGDNDFLAAQVAILIGAQRLVLLTNTEGLYSGDPARVADAQLIDEVVDFAALEQLEITQSTSAHGSGGMRSKVTAADMATAAGIETTICSGAREGVLARVLAGEHEGTRFPAHEPRYSSFKLWLKYAKPSRGVIVVDGGAAQALREEGTSLLPVGILEVRGGFEAGDAIDIVDANGSLGKGISSYSASELSRVKGLKSQSVRELLPRAAEEAVHRDYLVLD